MTATQRLTPKQELFVSEFLTDGNASAAAMRAGCEFRRKPAGDTDLKPARVPI